MVIRRKKTAIQTDRVYLGRVLKPHGLKGEVKFQSFNCSSEILESFDQLQCESQKKSFELEWIRGTEDSMIVKLLTIDTREDAESIHGEVLWVHEDEMPELEGDYFYASNLLYSDAYTEDGVCVGKVEDIIETGATDVLLIRGLEEHMIPVHSDWLLNVDKVNKKIIVKLIEFEEMDH